MLDVQNLCVSYDAHPVLVDISFSLPADAWVALVGANGAGKTTLLRTLSGLIRSTQGQIVLDGEAITGWSPSRICARGLIHVPEGRQIFPNMTVQEHLEIGAYLSIARKHRRTNLELVFDLFPRLQERMYQLAGTLSGGEQQMLAIGRGMMGHPRLLILDEPTLGLSPMLAQEVLAALQRWHRERVLPTIIASQEIMQILRPAHVGYVLEHGRLTLSGSGLSLLHHAHVQMAYLGETFATDDSI